MPTLAQYQLAVAQLPPANQKDEFEVMIVLLDCYLQSIAKEDHIGEVELFNNRIRNILQIIISSSIHGEFFPVLEEIHKSFRKDSSKEQDLHHILTAFFKNFSQRAHQVLEKYSKDNSIITKIAREMTWDISSLNPHRLSRTMDLATEEWLLKVAKRLKDHKKKSLWSKLITDIELIIDLDLEQSSVEQLVNYLQQFLLASTTIEEKNSAKALIIKACGFLTKLSQNSRDLNNISEILINILTISLTYPLEPADQYAASTHSFLIITLIKTLAELPIETQELQDKRFKCYFEILKNRNQYGKNDLSEICNALGTLTLTQEQRKAAILLLEEIVSSNHSNTPNNARLTLALLRFKSNSSDIDDASYEEIIKHLHLKNIAAALINTTLSAQQSKVLAEKAHKELLDQYGLDSYYPSERGLNLAANLFVNFPQNNQTIQDVYYAVNQWLAHYSNQWASVSGSDNYCETMPLLIFNTGKLEHNKALTLYNNGVDKLNFWFKNIINLPTYKVYGKLHFIGLPIQINQHFESTIENNIKLYCLNVEQIYVLLGHLFPSQISILEERRYNTSLRLMSRITLSNNLKQTDVMILLESCLAAINWELALQPKGWDHLIEGLLRNDVYFQNHADEKNKLIYILTEVVARWQRLSKDILLLLNKAHSAPLAFQVFKNLATRLPQHRLVKIKNEVSELYNIEPNEWYLTTFIIIKSALPANEPAMSAQPETITSHSELKIDDEAIDPSFGNPSPTLEL